MVTKKKIAIVGTNGIPAQYGGYETLAENLSKELNDRFNFIIYCSKNQKTRVKSFNGVKLKYFPLSANGWQSILYDILTLFDAAIKNDVILYLGPGAGYILPLIKLINKDIIVNHGGLNEWERKKYSKFKKKIAKIGHKTAARIAKINIADNYILKDSIKQSFGSDSVVIRYGGDHAKFIEPDISLIKKYPFLDKQYYINVSRAQVDNNLHLVLESFRYNPSKLLVMISNWNISDYGVELKKIYFNKYPNIILLDAIYDPKEVNAIRSNAFAYIHSHSYCGTSPSLVEAMSLGLPIISFDVPTNHETTQDKAIYFKDSLELTTLIGSLTDKELFVIKENMKIIAEKEYTWKKISMQYSDLFDNNKINTEK